MKKKLEKKKLIKVLVDFLHEVGKLKDMPRRGWVIREVKNPESIADHTFRATLLAWMLANIKGNLNIERLLKIALIHDLCEIYAGDTTPYDPILPKDRKKRLELVKTWPRFTEEQKKKIAEKKFKKESKSLDKLISKLPPAFKKEIKNLWLDYEKGLTPEGRFFRQADRMENFLQAIEYWKKDKKMPQKPWWLQAREFFDDPILLEFIEAIDKKFHKKEKPKH